MRLRQALASSVHLGVPNTFRTAVVCDAFERVAPMTGRYEGVLVLIWRELIRSLFMDFTPELPGSGAKVYERTPYYLEAKRLREQVAACERKLKRMMAQRQEELDALQGRNDLIARTLASWNRALAPRGRRARSTTCASSSRCLRSS